MSAHKASFAERWPAFLRLAAISVAAVLVAALLMALTPFRIAEGMLADLRIAFTPSPTSGRVLVAALDEASIATMRARRKQGGCACRSPLDEAYLAELIETGDRMGASVIGVDVVTDAAPDPAGRAVLLGTLERVDAVVVMPRGGDPAFERAASKVRFVNAPFGVIDDFDGVTRRHEPVHDGRPSMAVAMAQAAGAAAPAAPFTLRFRAPRDGARAIPVYPAHMLGALPAAWVAGRAVLIGRMETDPELPRLVEDQHLTPLRLRALYRAGLDGVEGHAHVIDQLLRGDRVRTPSPLLAAAIALAAGLAGAAAGRRAGGAVSGAVWALAGVTAILALSVWAFCRFGLLAPAVGTSAAFIAALVIANRTLSRDLDRQRRFLEQAFSRYLAPDVVRDLVRRPQGLALGAEKREISVISSDLQGFSGLVAASSDERLQAVMNAYLDGMIEVLWRHGALVDKLMGDGLLAIFGAPGAMPDHAARAVACARALDAFAEAFRVEAPQSFGVELGVTRIGVDSGEALVGNFGGALRFDYTAYGEVVVRAARLQAANKAIGGRVLIGAAAAEAAGVTPGAPIELDLPGLPGRARAFRAEAPPA